MNTAKEITNKLTIPTIGIGASKYCDGQVLVIDDIINLDSSNYKPKFIKTYTDSIVFRAFLKKILVFCFYILIHLV